MHVIEGEEISVVRVSWVAGKKCDLNHRFGHSKAAPFGLDVGNCGCWSNHHASQHLPPLRTGPVKVCCAPKPFAIAVTHGFRPALSFAYHSQQGNN